ncbi:MAG: hypothetical protein QMB24_08240, partial [Spirosomataceae bacterium]
MNDLSQKQKGFQFPESPFAFLLGSNRSVKPQTVIDYQSDDIILGTKKALDFSKAFVKRSFSWARTKD